MGLICVILTGSCFFLIGLLACFSPKPIASYIASALYFEDFKDYKTYFILLKYLMFFANVFLAGIIISFYKMKQSDSSSWFTLISVLSLLALGIGMFQSILDATQIPHLAKVYSDSPDVIQHVIIAFGIATPSLYIISLGIPGIWFIFMNMLFFKEFSRILVASGIAWGVGSIMTVFAHLFDLIWLIHFIAIASVVGVPIWTFLQTNFLLKEIKKYS